MCLVSRACIVLSSLYLTGVALQARGNPRDYRRSLSGSGVSTQSVPQSQPSRRRGLSVSVPSSSPPMGDPNQRPSRRKSVEGSSQSPWHKYVVQICTYHGLQVANGHVRCFQERHACTGAYARIASHCPRERQQQPVGCSRFPALTTCLTDANLAWARYACWSSPAASGKC